jgi:RNA polymerase sigma factor (sigma-70 family)
MTTSPDQFNPEQLISDYTPLVRYFARQYTRYGLSLDDLVQEGMLGLLEAGKRFDSCQNVQFETYAGYWIKKYILQAVGQEAKQSFKSTDFDENKHIGVTSKTNLSDSRDLNLPDNMPQNEKTILKLSYGEKKTIQDIADELHLSKEKVRQIRETALRRLRKNKSKPPKPDN